MQQSKQQSSSFWKGFLCHVRASILITSFIYDTWICLFFLMTCFTFPSLSWKNWHIWPTWSGFFLQFSVQHVGLPVATHCNSSERLTFTARLGLSFSFPTLQAAGSRCMQSPASWAHVFGFIHESQHTGGVGVGGGYFQTSCVDQSVKDLHELPTSGKTFQCTWIHVHVIPDVHQTYNHQLWFYFQSELHGHVSYLPGSHVVRRPVSQPR